MPGKPTGKRVRRASIHRDPAAKPRRLLGEGRAGHDEPEVALWTGRFSPRGMSGSWLLAALASPFLAIAAFFVIVPASAAALVAAGMLLALWGGLGLVLGWQQLDARYELSSRQLIHRRGILRRVTERIEVIDIDDVTVDQRLIDRIFGAGTIKIISSDRSHPRLRLSGIHPVHEVARLIDEARRAERVRRGLHIEAI